MNKQAQDLVNALAIKHAEDVFVPQCKTGPSTLGNRILDAWVMTKSWAHPLSIGYEIKVDRSDFINDKKWRSYLDYCNEFYFVCPAKLIQPEELPADVGLLWMNSVGSRFITKRKAPHRACPIPEDLYRYILMARIKIQRDVSVDKTLYWREWLTQRQIDYEFGCKVSKAIRQAMKSQIEAVHRRNEELEANIAQFKAIEAFCAQLGVNPTSWRATEQLSRKLAPAASQLSDADMEALTIAVASLTTLRNKCKNTT